MLAIVIFVFYLGLYIFLYNYSQSYHLQKLFSTNTSSQSAGFIANIFFPLGVPWFFLIFASVVWGLSDSPACPKFLRVISSDFTTLLWIVVLVSLALSYTVAYQVGRMIGYRDGQYQAKSHFPYFVREDASGSPTEIRGWIRHDSDIAVGSTLLYENRRFQVTSIVDDCRDDERFVIALYEANSESYPPKA